MLVLLDSLIALAMANVMKKVDVDMASNYYEDAYELAYSAGYDFYNQNDSAKIPYVSDSPFLSDPFIHKCFTDGFEEAKRESKLTGHMVTVFCPRGCNTSQVDSGHPYDECGACGSHMSQDDCDNFDESVSFSTGEYLH